MVDIYPFRALRPTTKKTGANISKFICPPYDVISAEERRQLIKKSNTNVVRVELPEGDPQKKFLNAGQLLQEWRGSHVVSEDRTASFYLLETTYKIADAFAPKTKLKRYGLMVSLRLETPGKGAVKPHEKTLPKAKEERLHLLRAVQTHVSPIFGLFFDNKKEWGKLISATMKKPPLCVGQEKKDLDHRMWKITDPQLQKKFQVLLQNKPLYIADGHHRYEVSWAFKEEMLQKTGSSNMSEGWNYVMTYICPMEEPGLLMLPTHRLIQSPKSFEEWNQHLVSVFDVEKVASAKEMITVLSKPKVRTIGWIHQRGVFLLKLKKELSIDRCFPTRVEALRHLDVILLHDLILEDPAGTKYLKDKNLIYTRDVKEIEAKVNADSSWTAFVLAPSGVESLALVATAGEVMPPKTTYFYPKVPTGFTMMSVSQRI